MPDDEYQVKLQEERGIRVGHEIMLGRLIFILHEIAEYVETPNSKRDPREYAREVIKAYKLMRGL